VLLPRFPPLQSGAAFSSPAFSVAPYRDSFVPNNFRDARNSVAVLWWGALLIPTVQCGSEKYTVRPKHNKHVLN